MRLILVLLMALGASSATAQSEVPLSEPSFISDRAKLLKCRRLLQQQTQRLAEQKDEKCPEVVLTFPPVPEVKKSLISLDALIGVLRVQPSALNGAGVQLGLNNAINEGWGVGLVLGQTFNNSSTIFYTQVSLELKRALVGRLIYESTSPEASSLMFHAFLHRNFVTTSSYDLGYFGLGSALSFEIPVLEKKSLRFGARADYSNRSQSSFWSFQFFAGLGHHF